MGFHECSCGASHDVRPEVDEIIETLGERIAVETPRGRWNIPRVYIAHHGIASNEIPALAAKYGWEALPRA